MQTQAPRGITFDLDDTLWDCAPVIAGAEEALYAWLQAECPRIAQAHDPESLRRHRLKIAQIYPQAAHDVTHLRLLALEDLARQHAYSRDIAEYGLALFRRHRNGVQLYAGVRPLLERLRRHYVLGAVSNGNADLGVIGIADLFRFTVFAGEAGMGKPDRRIFDEAAARAGLSPAEMVHIGDDPVNDVLGAAQAGWRSIWYNPALLPWPGGRVPDGVVRSLAECEALLIGWAQCARTKAGRPG